MDRSCPMTQMELRPRTVLVVAAVLFLAAGVAAVVGYSLLFPNPLMDRLWELNQPVAAAFRPLAKTMSVFLFVVGAGTACAAAGLLRGRKWAWWFAVLLFAADACGDALRLFITGEIWKSAAGVFVSCGFLYLLCRSDVKRYVSSDRTRR
jgi:hypothetical protein